MNASKPRKNSKRPSGGPLPIDKRCDPGCAGWFVNGESGMIERCDECKRFVDDDAAIAHVDTLCKIDAAAMP